MSEAKHAHPDTPITNKIIADADAHPETRVVFLIKSLVNKCREFERDLALLRGPYMHQARQAANLAGFGDGQAAALSEQTRRWIPCDESLPGVHEWVLACALSSDACMYIAEVIEGKWHSVDNGGAIDWVSHWMRLPDEPSRYERSDT